jgi:cell division protein FtsQ
MRVRTESLPRAKSRPAAARRRPRAKLTRRMLRLAAYGIASAAAISGSTYAVESGWADKQVTLVANRLIQITAQSGFRVRNVLVEGRVETKSGDILAALKAERGAPLLDIDVAAAKARLEGLPWIKSAEVERQLPDTLRVKVEERKPFALWQLGQRLSVIDREGVVIVKDNVGRFADRPLVVGEGAERRAAEILDLVASEPAISKAVDAAVLVSGRRWNLRLKGGIEVRLPEEGMDAAWHRLARMERETRLLNKAITAIDLRQSDRVIVGLTPEAAKAPQGPGEST